MREMRNSKGMSQEQLSERSGLDRSFISMLERGKRNPTLSSMVKLCNALGISLTELITEFEAMEIKAIEAEREQHRTE